MRKKNFKGRCEKRMLDKCKDVCRTYDAIQYAYADILSDCSDIVEFRCNVFLEGLEEGEYTNLTLVLLTIRKLLVFRHLC